MGGEGSGRKPDVFRKIEEQRQAVAKMSADSLYIPNYSGVKTEARKTENVRIITEDLSVNIPVAFPDNKYVANWVDMTQNVALFHCDDTSGNILDSCGNSNDLVPNNVYYNSSGLIDKCISFDGTSSYAYKYSTDFAFGTGDFTVSIWIKPTGLNGTIFDNLKIGDSYARNNAFVIQMTGDGGLLIYANGTWQRFSAQKTIVLNEWNHIVLKRSGTTFYFYINGIEDANTWTGWTSNLTSGGCMLGRVSDTAAYYFEGYYDEVAIWKGKALSQSEITTIYNKQHYGNKRIDLFSDVNLNGRKIIADGSQLTNISAFNPFDQELNTSDSPIFSSIYTSSLFGSGDFNNYVYYDDYGTITIGDLGSYYGGGYISIDLYGNLYVTGKLTSSGGYDPPYVLYDLQTKEQIKERTLKEIPINKQNGAALFFNSETKKFNYYVATEDKFYNLNGEEI